MNLSIKEYLMTKHIRLLFILIFSIRVFGWNTWKHYNFYEPLITKTTIYDGIHDGSTFSYNHCVSIEYFNDKFYCAWQGNTSGIETDGTLNMYLSTSNNVMTNWSSPIMFLKSSDTCRNPLGSNSHQVQVGLLNYQDTQLWCFSLNTDTTHASEGIIFSVLYPGSGEKWFSTLIHSLHMVVDGKDCMVYTSGNPYLCSTGRVLLPIVAQSSAKETIIYKNMARDERRRYCGVLYSDNAGSIWNLSNFVSLPSEFCAAWEPTVCEQIDGKIRMFVRNGLHPEYEYEYQNALQYPNFLTTVGIGVELGESILFEEDLQVSDMQIFGDRAYITRLSGDRHLLLHHDLYTYRHAVDQRKNTALYFSRSGADDFVAGPSLGSENAQYPQGLEYNGKIYVGYSSGGIIITPNITEMDIKIAVFDPAPSSYSYYIWPRDDHFYLEGNCTYVKPQRTISENREVILIQNRGSAGVETDAIDFENNDILKVEMDVKVNNIQNRGNLIICSFGDKIPIRIGVPSNRPNKVYVFSSKGWQLADEIDMYDWFNVKIQFGRKTFSVQINNQQVTEFENPANDFSPRFYLGDGYEIDSFFDSNADSEFVIDLTTFQTYVEHLQPSHCDTIIESGGGLEGDVNFDCSVDFTDLSIMALNWNQDIN